MSSECVRFKQNQLPGKCIINVGSRNSQLALIQTKIVIDSLTAYYANKQAQLKEVDSAFENGVDFNIIGMTTVGDRILDKALPDIGAKSLFTKDLEVALMESKVDFIVHSLKDLPTKLPQGCVIGTVMMRDDPNDAIVLKNSLRGQIDPIDLIFEQQVAKNHGKKFRIGTSSHRRMAILRRCNPELECVNIRGNLNTRLAKLDKEDGDYAAIILAKAGLDRMGWNDRVSSLLSPDTDTRLAGWCYAVGQGAIAIECRQDDKKIIDLLAPICDMKTTFEIVAERSLMRTLEGGCSVPLGVRSSWHHETLMVKSLVLSIDGTSVVEACDKTDLAAIGESTLEMETSEALTTGVLISNKIENSNLLRAKMIACSKLGVRLANKMIDLGCLELMRCS